MPSARTSERYTGRKAQVRRKPRGATKGDLPKLLDVLEWLDDGEARTRADVLIDSVRRNVPVPTACDAAGVDQSSFRTWLKQGADIAAERAAMQAGVTPWRQLAKRDEALWWFHQQITQASAQAAERVIHGLDDLATGENLRAGHVTRKLLPDPTGRIDPKTGQVMMIEVERTERAARVLPDRAAAQFLLERRHPEHWGKTDGIEISGGAVIEHRHTHTVPALDSLLDGIAARITDPIETTADELQALDEPQS